ncbi:MAG: hypothetical protein QOD42_251 [Sphingomonadales bacterium]|jgi:hypothetical protein|nr:hypothetical protein [Sphingomonadales bacterium]
MIGWIVLAAALAVFAATALSGRKDAADVESFFHVEGRRRNALSLGIADITLGTGFAYILIASSQFGWAMLALPAGLWVGYRLLAWLFIRAPAEALVGTRNFLLAVREAAVRDGGLRSRWLFDAAVTLPLILVFILFVAYEVFASSQIMAAFIAPDVPMAPAIIGGAIVAVSGLNSIVGGMQSNFRNDRVLAAGILLLFAIVGFASIFASAPIANVAPSPPLSAVLIVAALGFLAAVATQFYSLLNSYNASNFEKGTEAARVFRQVGSVIAAMLAFLVVVGVERPLALGAGFPAALGERLAALPIGQTGHVALAALAVVGMVAVVFSTVDTLLIALAYFIRRHLLGRPTDAASTENEVLAPTRRLVAVLAFGILPPLAALYLADPNLFTLLLTLGGGAAIYAPFVFVTTLALSNTVGLTGLRPAFLLVFPALFIASGVTGVVLMSRDPAAVPMFTLGWLAVAIAASALWWISNRR